MKLSKTQNAVVVLIGFSITLVLLRVQYTQSLFFSFLLWNIFLATIPYGISEGLKKFTFNKTQLIFILGIWLLFLPNAPYMITDIVHLKNSRSTLVWFDIFMLFSFANTGLILTIISMNDVYKILEKKFNRKSAGISIGIVSILCGFGIYIGRFVRLNSWDLFTNPFSVVRECLSALTKSGSWFTTIGFATLIWILLATYRTFSITRK